MIWFLHRIIHRAAYRLRVHTLVAAGRHPVSLPEVKCPRCGDWYFADAVSPDDEPRVAGPAIYEARRVLFTECPDHAHAFFVDA